ncbi:MAG: dienelactone hydrolase family protein [Adhaeribacter sp.]
MKKLLITCLFLSLGLAYSFAQTAHSHTPNHSCCTNPYQAPTAFAMLTHDKQFVSGHASPLPYVHVSAVGKMITFTTPDGKTGRAYELKPAKKSNKYLFVFQEWWGLNDHIKKEAESYFNDLGEVNVIALDLYDGKIATNSEEAVKLVQAVNSERAEAIIKGAQEYAGKKAEIATIGWCFGGGWSLQAAIIGGKQTVGCVMFYGMPEKNVDRLKMLNSDVLGFFAGKEKNINPEVVKEFEANMKAAGKKIRTRIYDAEHAFANASNPNYHQKFAAETHRLAASYLRDRFDLKEQFNLKNN